MANPRAEPWLRDEIDPAAQELPELRQKSSQVEETATGLEVDQEIDVAFRSGVAPGDGTEDAHVARSMPRRRGEDFIPLFL